MRRPQHVEKPLHMDSRIAKVMQDVEVLQKQVKTLNEKFDILTTALIEYSKKL